MHTISASIEVIYINERVIYSFWENNCQEWQCLALSRESEAFLVEEFGKGNEEIYPSVLKPSLVESVGESSSRTFWCSSTSSARTVFCFCGKEVAAISAIKTFTGDPKVTQIHWRLFWTRAGIPLRLQAAAIGKTWVQARWPLDEFFFTLKNPHKTQAKRFVQDCASYGLAFGLTGDISVSDDCTANRDSQTSNSGFASTNDTGQENVFHWFRWFHSGQIRSLGDHRLNRSPVSTRRKAIASRMTISLPNLPGLWYERIHWYFWSPDHSRIFMFSTRCPRFCSMSHRRIAFKTLRRSWSLHSFFFSVPPTIGSHSKSSSRDRTRAFLFESNTDCVSFAL
jgi:hypothetical protein